MTTTETVPAVAPCPAWCELPAGHPYDDKSDRHRHHVRRFGDGVEISSCENATCCADNLTEPGIEAYLEIYEGSPEEAEEYAAALTAAAAYLRSIQAGAHADD